MMQPSRKIAISLHHEKTGASATVLLPMNEHGRLPTLLIDPIDSSGRAVPGRWFAEDDYALNATYRRVVPDTESADDRGGIADDESAPDASGGALDGRPEAETMFRLGSA
jgi:hypothetical protein